MKLTLHEIAKVVGAKMMSQPMKMLPLSKIEFDSRKITAGWPLFATKRFSDGHEILSKQPLTMGALATFYKKVAYCQAHIPSRWCSWSLQKLAAYYLEKENGVDVIAVTGF